MQKYKKALLRREVGFLQTLLIFNALSLSFYSMVYQTCIGNVFDERSLIPLMQLTFGLTEVVASLLFERITTRVSNKLMSVFLYVLMLICMFLMFLMFPANSTMRRDDSATTFIGPKREIVLLISVLLAVSDCGFNIIANSSVGVIFEGDTDVGFMMLNAVMSLGTGTIFFISSQLSLTWIVILEVVFGTIATVCIVLNTFKTSYLD